MTFLIFVLFSSIFFESFRILTSHLETNNFIQITAEHSIRNIKPDVNVTKNQSSFKDKNKLNMDCVNFPVNSTQNTHLTNTVVDVNSQIHAILHLSYYEELGKKKPKFKGNQYIKVSDNLYTYRVQSFSFSVEIYLLKKEINSNTQSNQKIFNFDDLSIVDLINRFTSFFCEFHLTEDNIVFTIKKEFKYLELIVPELSPFIYFINKFKTSLTGISCFIIFLSKIDEFNTSFNNWISEYYTFFNINFLKEISGNKNMVSFLRYLSIDHKLHFSKFKSLLIDFLEIIGADKNIIKNYKFIKILHDYNIKENRYAFGLDINFFIYFITCAGSKSKKYLQRFRDYNHIVDKENYTKDEIKSGFAFIYQSMGSKVFMESVSEYDQMLLAMKMLPIDIQENLAKFIDFESGEFNGFYFYYDCNEEGKYEKRVHFMQFLRLLMLNFLRQVLTN